MTTMVTKARSHESILNDNLARLFRELCGFAAVAETLQSGPQPAILIRLGQGPVVVETEFEPASPLPLTGGTALKKVVTRG